VKTIGGANLTFDRGPMDQRPIGTRPDYLRFHTEPLERDVLIAGPVTMDLWASTDGPDTDFVVKLVDVYPDGYEAIILDSAIRTRYRNGRMPDQIEMMTPGAPAMLTIDLWDTALTFEKVEKGPHTLFIEAPGFVPTTLPVLTDGQPMLSIPVTLKRQPGKLIVTSEPTGATVVIDNKATHQLTPATFELDGDSVHATLPVDACVASRPTPFEAEERGRDEKASEGSRDTRR
jgi:hypothetical protein